MRRPRPLPASLTRGPFTTADAREAGVGGRRLRADDIAHPFYGVGSASPVEGLDRILAVVLRMRPGQVISHTSALAVWGAPVPWEPRVHISVEFPRTPPRAAGIIGHALQHIAPTMRSGAPVSEPAAAWCEAAATLTIPQLVAAGDALATGPRREGVRRPGLVTLTELEAASGARSRAAGALRARRALSLVRTGVDSPRETELRLLLRRCRLPEPALDHPVHVADRTLHADLAYPHLRVALEYEGDRHRTDRRRWMHDIRRREAMEDAGWRVIRVVADDLADPRPLVARLRRLLRS